MATIALDYDGTFTADPEMWLNFLELARSRHHTVHLVTMRYDKLSEATPVRNALEGKVDSIIFTGRAAKKAFLADRGVTIDIWIDDNPAWIYQNSL